MNWLLFWVIIAAFGGVLLHLLIAQLTGGGSWKTFIISMLSGIAPALGFGLHYQFTGNFMIDIIGAILGGFGLSTAITYHLGMKAIRNQVAAMQNPVPKK
jgi:hypothetical protein